MNLRGFEEFKKRRSQRCADRGIAMEDEVEGVLRRAMQEGKIASVVHHSRSMPDIDFTVTRMIGEVPPVRLLWNHFVH